MITFFQKLFLVWTIREYEEVSYWMWSTDDWAGSARLHWGQKTIEWAPQPTEFGVWDAADWACIDHVQQYWNLLAEDHERWVRVKKREHYVKQREHYVEQPCFDFGRKITSKRVLWEVSYVDVWIVCIYNVCVVLYFFFLLVFC